MISDFSLLLLRLNFLSLLFKKKKELVSLKYQKELLLILSIKNLKRSIELEKICWI